MKMQTIARFGYSARSMIYLLMGVFPLLLVFGHPEGTTTGPKGAVLKLFQQPLGQMLLFILAAGFFSYAVWVFYQSLFNRIPGTSSGVKNWARRIGFAFAGYSYGMLGYYTIKLLLFHRAGGDNSEKRLAHKILTLPFGHELLMVVSLIILGFGAQQFYKAWTNKLNKRLALPSESKKWITIICKFGYAARGFVFMLIGMFFWKAAQHLNSSEVGGIAKAWGVLRSQPYGDFLIVLVGLGFIAFAIYGFAEAKYVRVEAA